jgi:hypothetical protein
MHEPWTFTVYFIILLLKKTVVIHVGLPGLRQNLYSTHEAAKNAQRHRRFVTVWRP